MTRLDTGPADARTRLVLAHGAGAGIDSPFMQTFADLLAARRIAVTRFEFGYMAARRDGGKRRPPPKAETLIGEYEAVVREVCAGLPSPLRGGARRGGRQDRGVSKLDDRDTSIVSDLGPPTLTPPRTGEGNPTAGAFGYRLFIGGKSMGGRVASMLADRLYAEGLIAGLVCLGYPFHPPAKPERLRTAHLGALVCPALIVQGERDPFGRRDEVEGMHLSPAIALRWIGDGDHDLGPRGGSGFTRAGNLATAADAVAAFATSDR